MGLSFGVGYNMRYNNFVDELALQGVTNSRAFSVALGSKAENNGGMIIFGGMDLKKFRGPLFRSAILPPQGDDLLHRYYVTMESVGLTPSGSPTRTLVPSNLTVVLDTGATLSYLPGNLAAAVAAEVGAYIFPGDESQTYVIDCGATKSDTAVEFKFEGGATIRVPMHEMVWELALEPDSLPNGAPPVCVWGIQSGDQLGISLLGDTFLRSAYVVFDQDSNAIFMAQYENCGSREVTIPAGRDAVANFTGECTTAGASAARKNAGARTSFSTAAPWIAATAAVAGVQLLLGLA